MLRVDYSFLPKIVMFVGVITQFMLELYLFLPFTSLNPFSIFTCSNNILTPSTKIDNKLRNEALSLGRWNRKIL